MHLNRFIRCFWYITVISPFGQIMCLNYTWKLVGKVSKFKVSGRQGLTFLKGVSANAKMLKFQSIFNGSAQKVVRSVYSKYCRKRSREDGTIIQNFPEKKRKQAKKSLKRCFFSPRVSRRVNTPIFGWEEEKTRKKVCQPLLLFCGGWNEDGNNIFLLSQKFPFLSLVKWAESAEKFWGKQSG